MREAISIAILFIGISIAVLICVMGPFIIMHWMGPAKALGRPPSQDTTYSTWEWRCADGSKARRTEVWRGAGEE